MESSCRLSAGAAALKNSLLFGDAKIGTVPRNITYAFIKRAEKLFEVLVKLVLITVLFSNTGEINRSSPSANWRLPSVAA
jgi:hypothetical protein